MAKNRVQFQPGMSLPEFLQDYGSEAQCRQALARMRWSQGFHCPICNYAGHCQLHHRAVWQCNRCKHQVSLTSGTVFSHSKLPLRTWFLAIYLLTQNKNGISALSLHRHLGVSANTAWLIKHKLMQAMIERDDGQPLHGVVQLDDAYWGGERHGGGTGRGSPGKTPFVAAVQLSTEGHPQALRLDVIRGFRKPVMTRWARRHLTRGTAVMSDGLSCFRGVTAARCTHHPRRTGGGPLGVQHPAFHWVNTVLGNVKNALHGTYHALRPKYLPRYLAEFCYRFNRRFHLEDLIPRLLYAAAHSPPLPYRLATLDVQYG